MRLANRPAPVARQRLHLDHVRTVLGQQHGAMGTGNALGGVEHTNSFKRTHGWRFLFFDIGSVTAIYPRGAGKVTL